MECWVFADMIQSDLIRDGFYRIFNMAVSQNPLFQYSNIPPFHHLKIWIISKLVGAKKGENAFF
jgi:hypothetical protein